MLRRVVAITVVSMFSHGVESRLWHAHVAFVLCLQLAKLVRIFSNFLLVAEVEARPRLSLVGAKALVEQLFALHPQYVACGGSRVACRAIVHPLFLFIDCVF